MIEEPPIIVFVIFFSFMLGCFCYGCGRTEHLEKQAISRGYATYDANGVFQWKEQEK